MQGEAAISDILTAQKGPIFEITFNRPQDGNAASDDMAELLTGLLLGIGGQHGLKFFHGQIGLTLGLVSLGEVETSVGQRGLKLQRPGEVLLGAFEVDVEGNIASWMIPGKLIKGMGGAMDLVAAAENIIVTMMHASKGASKLLQKCSLPLTGSGCIRRVLTDLAYLEIEGGAFVLKERAPGVSVDEIRAMTAGKLVVNGDIPEMTL